MQKFFILIIGMVLGIIIITILIPLTYDYSNRMALSQLLNEIKPLQQQIEKGLHDNNLQTQLIKSKQEYQDLLKNNHIDYLDIFEDGQIFIKASPRGETFLMIPEYSSSTITWNCLGGSNKDVPAGCQK